ncbi:hypothetical protein AB0K80_00200 [Streptomyces sp. NPDC052682]|uniref:hypothetical protein n=1 Tax=Streptomyces sp. NPDC052682 TaxID=3154954 RepID=UPI0034359BF2
MLFAARQAHANEFSDWSCKNIPFADKICNTVEATNKAVDFTTDPLGYIAQFFNNAVTSLFTQMIKALLSTTRIDWGNPGFLRTYSMAFAASAVLTVILWLIAAAKRALQGVPPLQALGESIGFLLISVVVSALAPAAVAYVTELFDEAAEAMFAPVAGDAASMVVTVTAGMAALMAIPGGAVIVIFLAMCMLTAVAGVWLELIVRNALILAGLVFGASVFSGLVDRSLWNHTKRWVGVMGAIIASKYVTLTTIALATGMLSTSGHGDVSVVQAFATVFTALALLFLALFLPFSLAKFLPLVGDELQHMYQARDDFKGRAQNLGSQVGDTFGELRSRFGGGWAGGDDGAADDPRGSAANGGDGGGGEPETGTGEEAAGAEGAAASTGVGAAAVAGKQGADMAKDQAESAADRAADGALAGTGDDAHAAPDTPAPRPETGAGGTVGSGPGTPESGPDGPTGFSTEHMPPPSAPVLDHTAVHDNAGDAPAAAPPSWPLPEPTVEEPPPGPDDDQLR